ncbi:hypothetical protein NQ314_010532 [Rhamnusium bicolor]|uniref:C2 domain-containing protein n=1 Tax=Rhamnusium bicolor TaxID=1586634 RepID=A0AAV8XR52_9CUCU|nr:hypothetical protein NQ314_010532 [Rhamnusium bicolor]
MSEKSQTFLITIAVLEGRHYFWTNMDSAVIVKVDNKKRCTSVKYKSDSPYYNEVLLYQYFVFEFFTTYGKIVDKNITMMVSFHLLNNVFKIIKNKIVTRLYSHEMCAGREKILGYFTLDVATVWSQKYHQFYHKWAILSSPKSDPFLGPRGYLKVDISILTKGQVSKIPFNIINEEIEGNLLLPEGPNNDRLKAFYIFDIFKCEHLIEKPNTAVYDAPLDTSKSNATGPNSYVEISFAGITVKTSLRKNTCFPVFNERLTIIDLFPPLCQRIKIDICYGDCLKKSVYATKYISLKLISNDKEEGFLPTFGPTMLHMYFDIHLEGYAGTILMSMYTELDEHLNDAEPTKSSTLVHSILAINEVCNVKMNLKKLEKIFENDQYVLMSNEIDDLLLEALDYISSSGKKYIDIVNQYSSEYSTNLDKERKGNVPEGNGNLLMFLVFLATHIIEKVESICFRRSKKGTLWKLQKICRKIEALIEDVNIFNIYIS